MYIETCKDNYKNKIETYAKEKGINQREAQSLINTVNLWEEQYDDLIVLGVSMNKIDNMIVAVFHNSTIYLINRYYNTVMYAPKIVFSIRNNNIHIDDILMKHNNCGNGTAAMFALFQYAKLINARSITGDLSSVDDDHKSRRDHYYNKLGFEIHEKYVLKRMDGYCEK